MKQLKNEFSKLIKSSVVETLYGEIGIYNGSIYVIEVPNRSGYVYVRLRNNPSEFVQAYNEIVTNLQYGIPVTLERNGGKYRVSGYDNKRYATWMTQDPSDGGARKGNKLAHIIRHGSAHSFDPSVNMDMGGGDITWVFSRQFMPGLVTPYNEVSPNVYIAPLTIQNKNGDWKYLGNVGTEDIVNYRPTTGTRMVLVTMNSITGVPYLIVSTGTFIPYLSGSMSLIYDYMPVIPNTDYIPLAVVVLNTGTAYVGWDNLYDVREFFNRGSFLSINGTGSFSNVNFPNAAYTYSGSNATIEFLGGGGGSGNNESVLFSVDGRLATGSNMSNLYIFTSPTKLSEIYAYSDTLGVTGSTILDINLIRSGSSSTIFTTQANRPTLQYNDANGWVMSVPDVQDFGVGDVLSLDIDQVSNGITNLVVAKMITGSSTGGSSSSLTVGSPDVANVKKIVFNNGSVTDDGGGQVTIRTVPHDYILLHDERPGGTEGGAAVANTWTTRVINTEVADTGGLCSLSSNQFTLAAGTYEISAICAFYSTSTTQLRLRNATDNTTILLGIVAHITAGGGYINLCGRFQITSPKALDIQYIAEKAQATYGVGNSLKNKASNYTDVEIYASVELRRVA